MTKFFCVGTHDKYDKHKYIPDLKLAVAYKC